MKRIVSAAVTAAMLFSLGTTVFANEEPILANNPLVTGKHEIAISTGEESQTGIKLTGSAEYTVNDGATVTYVWDYDKEEGTLTVTDGDETKTTGFTVSKDSIYYPRGIHAAGDQTEITGKYEVTADTVFVTAYGHIGTPVEYTVYCQTSSGKVIGDAAGYVMKGYAGETIPVPAPEVNGYKLKTENPQITLKLTDPSNPEDKNEITLIYSALDSYQEITETVIVPGGGSGSGTGTGEGTNSGATIEDESTPQGGTNSGTNSGANIEDNSVPVGPGPDGGSGMTKYIPVAAGGIGLLLLLALLAKKKKEDEEPRPQA